MYKTFPIEKFKGIRTPFYYYDADLLRETLKVINNETEKYENFKVHYAVKANANQKVLKIIKNAGIGIDCVSGGEINAVLEAGFSGKDIVFAGVGKDDWEIELGIDNDILCFNVESIPELEVINEIAERKNRVANVCLRINPNVGAHTHANITTGLAENKFGIALEDMEHVIEMVKNLKNVHFYGLHFHIGSQILDMSDFENLCAKVNEIQDELEQKNIVPEIINVGGGLGIDYYAPDENPIPDFQKYFSTYNKNLKLRKGQELHFELGRAVVGQCGSLITKVIFVKQGSVKKFAIVDAGMTDLIRPALYDAHHEIENISCNEEETEKYDVVGPICESSDVFAKDIVLKKTKRGDLIAIRSAGAYGEIMASSYNCRALPKGFISDEIL